MCRGKRQDNSWADLPPCPKLYETLQDIQWHSVWNLDVFGLSDFHATVSLWFPLGSPRRTKSWRCRALGSNGPPKSPQMVPRKCSQCSNSARNLRAFPCTDNFHIIFHQQVIFFRYLPSHGAVSTFQFVASALVFHLFDGHTCTTIHHLRETYIHLPIRVFFLSLLFDYRPA